MKEGTAFGDELADLVRAFVQQQILPIEQRWLESGDAVDEALRTELQDLAREAGLLAPQVAPEWGGLGLNQLARAKVFIAAGYSILGPLALNIAAPDEGNMHLLEAVATDEQKKRYLRALAAGEIRSAFAMTEPAPGAGSDPAALHTEAHPRARHDPTTARRLRDRPRGLAWAHRSSSNRARPRVTRPA